MKLAIHQPVYMPWLGYFDKMAKVDKFVIFDECQVVPKSLEVRNRFPNRNGEIVYLTVNIQKKGFREKNIRQIELCDTEMWQNKHKVFLKDTYKYSPYFDEVYSYLDDLYTLKYTKLEEITVGSIMAGMKILGIDTTVIYQGDLEYDRHRNKDLDVGIRRSRDVMDIVEAARCDEYMTGAGGSLEFLNLEEFNMHGIKVAIQDYDCPIYEQRHTPSFVPNISAFDFFFCCGIEKSREIFWDNVNRKKEPYR